MPMLQALARQAVRGAAAQRAAMLRAATPVSAASIANRFVVPGARIFLQHHQRRLLASAAENLVPTPPPSLWQRINARVNRIPKSLRIGIRVIRVAVLAVTLYALGKAEGMAEYATDPEGYRRNITLQVAQQFVAEGRSLQDTIVAGETEARVTRIMAKVIEGAQKSLDRLQKAATDQKEQQRYARAQVRTRCCVTSPLFVVVVLVVL
jgi:hypothetical protein